MLITAIIGARRAGHSPGVALMRVIINCHNGAYLRHQLPTWPMLGGYRQWEYVKEAVVFRLVRNVLFHGEKLCGGFSLASVSKKCTEVNRTSFE